MIRKDVGTATWTVARWRSITLNISTHTIYAQGVNHTQPPTHRCLSRAFRGRSSYDPQADQDGALPPTQAAPWLQLHASVLAAAIGRLEDHQQRNHGERRHHQ
jgi:hypothetical protein